MPFSKFAENKLQNLTKKFSKEFRIVFNTFKLASLFSTKDKVPHGLKSYEIYKFLCTDCNASYVDEPTDMFIPKPMNIWKPIKTLIFTDTSIKPATHLDLR